jgi:methenyltetrahydromethanopterin cyclohydrolase
VGDVTSDSTLSVNGRAEALVDGLRREAAALNVRVSKGPLGETLIDAGSTARGGLAAGLRIADICMGGLGHASLRPDAATPRWPWTLAVTSSQPVIACLGSQYAGWNLSHGKGPGAFFALGSGPARALAQKEKIFEDIGYRDACDSAILVIESDRPPPPEIIEKVAGDCRVAAAAVTVIYAPTQSLAGGAQVVARVLEVALHKAHELAFPIERIVDGMGAAPLSPPHPDFVTAMGRTNDAIIYGGRVQLFVTGPEADARSLARGLPSDTSRDFGAPFAEIFKRFKGDFYAIDPMLFSPAEIVVTAVDTGASFRGGRLHQDLLDASFG